MTSLDHLEIQPCVNGYIVTICRLHEPTETKHIASDANEVLAIVGLCLMPKEDEIE